MKVGLITVFHVPNYGAMLQCYALSTYLKRLGHEVFLYDVSWSNTNPILCYLKRKLMLGFMSDFISNNLPRITSDLTETADIYMVGSDQVWNPDILGDSIDKFMLSFVPSGSKKVAYAASFGCDEWTDESHYETAKELLKDFSYITVREDSGVELLRQQFGIHARQVLDPCLLLHDYTPLMSGKGIAKTGNDLVTFKLVYSYDWCLQAKTLANSLRCNFAELNGRRLKNKGDIHGVNVRSCSVSDWLSSIANAKYVLTDSFHGSVFAILFGRQFAVIPSISKRQTRLTSLLSSLGLSDRFSVNVADCKAILERPINYDAVYSRLAKLREASVQQLTEMLKV